MGYFSKPLHTPNARHRDRRGGAATRRLQRAFIDRLPDPGTTPDPKRAEAFSQRRTSRWRQLRRRWTHILTGVLVVVAATLIVLAFRPTSPQTTLTSVRIENRSAEHAFSVALHNEGREYFVGFVARDETLSYAVRGVRPEGLSLSVSDSIVARCCAIPAEASGVVVFQGFEDGSASGESQWTVESLPEE